jgi:hypothetical protein
VCLLSCSRWRTLHPSVVRPFISFCWPERYVNTFIMRIRGGGHCLYPIYQSTPLSKALANFSTPSTQLLPLSHVSGGFMDLGPPNSIELWFIKVVQTFVQQEPRFRPTISHASSKMDWTWRTGECISSADALVQSLSSYVITMASRLFI